MPNWKDPKAYAKKYDRAGWAWEFMRRNPDYRDDFALVARAWKAVPRRGRFFASAKTFEVDHLARQLGAKWGQLDAIADPRNDAVPRFVMLGPVQPDGEQVDGFFYEPKKSGRFVQRPEFATLTFDLRRPLGPQLKRAGFILKRRKSLVASIKPVRFSGTQWQLYLRVLDAKEANVKTSEIVASIKAYRIPEHDAAVDRVFDHFKAARKLRDNPLAVIL